MKEILLQYARYNLWANTRLVKMAGKLDALNLDKEVNSSFPSLRKTIYHIWDAELIWMSRLKGETLTWPPTAEIKNPTFDKFIQNSDAFSAYLENQNEEYFSEKTIYKNSRGKEFENVNSGIIMHCFNHSTYHRGQAVTILRGLGISEIMPTDLIAFLR